MHNIYFLNDIFVGLGAKLFIEVLYLIIATYLGRCYNLHFTNEKKEATLQTIAQMGSHLCPAPDVQHKTFREIFDLPVSCLISF